MVLTFWLYLIQLMFPVSPEFMISYLKFCKI